MYEMMITGTIDGIANLHTHIMTVCKEDGYQVEKPKKKTRLIVRAEKIEDLNFICVNRIEGWPDIKVTKFPK